MLSGRKALAQHKAKNGEFLKMFASYTLPGDPTHIKTYAFLDNGLNTSFCSEELSMQLGLSGRPTTLSLTTMEKENSRAKSLVVSLEVFDLEEENIVALPVVFTRPKLPDGHT